VIQEYGTLVKLLPADPLNRFSELVQHFISVLLNFYLLSLPLAAPALLLRRFCVLDPSIGMRQPRNAARRHGRRPGISGGRPRPGRPTSCGAPLRQEEGNAASQLAAGRAAQAHSFAAPDCITHAGGQSRKTRRASCPRHEAYPKDRRTAAALDAQRSAEALGACARGPVAVQSPSGALPRRRAGKRAR
jgi:hypothetical protein